MAINGGGGTVELPGGRELEEQSELLPALLEVAASPPSSQVPPAPKGPF